MVVVVLRVEVALVVVVTVDVSRFVVCGAFDSFKNF